MSHHLYWLALVLYNYDKYPPISSSAVQKRWALSLLLVGLVGRQLGLKVGLQGVQTVTCSRWGPPSNQSLFQDGDVIFGGLFNLHYQTPAIDHDFIKLQHFKPCTGLEYAPLQYMYAMVFALEEINDNPTLLPGVKLGYHMFDCCGQSPWAPQAALSLAGGDSVSCNLSDDSVLPLNNHPVPLIIGGASSVTAETLSRILGPLSVPLLLQHLNKVNFTTPQGEEFYFQDGDIPAKYDLVNWQNTPEGTLQLVLVGHVVGFDIHLNESAIQWSTGSSQVPTSVCSENCRPGSRKSNRKGEPVCCFDCIPCAEGEISNKTGSLSCDQCPLEFWSNANRTTCVPRQLDFLSFNETLGITLTTAAVSGAVMTTAVFVVFLRFCQTPVVRANNSELSFLLLLSLKLCFLCSLVFIGRPSVWSCRFQQAAFGISFVLCVSCLQVKTIVVLAAFRSARPGAEALIKWFGPVQQRGSFCVFTSIQIIICALWLSHSPPVPKRDLGFHGSKVILECSMASLVGFSLVLGYIALLAFTCLILAFLARKLPDNFNEAKLITFSMLIFCAVWVAFVPAYVSSPGKYTVAVEVFAILASSYGLLFCIFAPKCFIILLRPEKNTKKHLMTR
ncbi:extracellular calcium-sensing receptor-like [Channa argus]|uniref:extracellular calcium-sensing receptor-like n=1 Tax=Channa argus TaxID=215402 RepID=UPI003520D7FE